MKIDTIKGALIKSCIKGKAYYFLPFLFSKKVRTNFPNKRRFYSFYKRMICCSKRNSIGKLELKIEKNNAYDDNQLAYSFYDQINKYPRLNLTVEETENYICIDVMPF